MTSDFSGKRFGRLVVLGKAEKKGRHTRYLCVCDCGKKKSVDASNLKSGCTRSCGCLHKEISVRVNTIHGERKTRLYDVWKSMLQRCTNPNSKDYKNYGGRGIQVCSSWIKFPDFSKWAYAAGYDPDAPRGDCTIDRIDVDGNYCPDNCRWVSMKIQNQNRRKSKKE